MKSYKININGEWAVEDLYLFAHTYNQIYSFFYTLDFNNNDIDREKLEITYRAHPWYGGYSAVNFYHYLWSMTPKKHRPKIISMHLASPGWFELGLVVAVASNLERIIKACAKSTIHINDAYNQIYKGLQERKLLRIKVKKEELSLRREEIAFLEESSAKMCRLMGFEGLELVKKLANNPRVSLKIILAA